MNDDFDLSVPEKPLPKVKSDDFMEKVFAYIESISYTKKNLMVTERDEAFYIKARWMIFRALSFHHDVVSIVNVVNGMNMPPRMEYQFLMNLIPSRFRKTGRWPKKSPKSVYMETIQQYYGYNESKSEEAMKILTIEQMTMIDKKNKKEDTWIFSGGGV